MWRRLKNIFASFRTYADLSPDLQVRRQVSRFLHDRPCLTMAEWCAAFCELEEISPAIAEFVYVYLSGYSGLEFARVQPQDRLEEDLQLSLVCWFDWQLSLCDDFFKCFGIDLSDRFDAHDLKTVADLVLFLEHQFLAVNHP
jgi:hypothetical protein